MNTSQQKEIDNELGSIEKQTKEVEDAIKSMPPHLQAFGANRVEARRKRRAVHQSRKSQKFNFFKQQESELDKHYMRRMATFWIVIFVVGIELVWGW